MPAGGESASDCSDLRSSSSSSSSFVVGCFPGSISEILNLLPFYRRKLPHTLDHQQPLDELLPTADRLKDCIFTHLQFFTMK
jgi:hypothetical protein